MPAFGAGLRRSRVVGWVQGVGVGRARGGSAFSGAAEGAVGYGFEKSLLLLPVLRRSSLVGALGRDWWLSGGLYDPVGVFFDRATRSRCGGRYGIVNE